MSIKHPTILLWSDNKSVYATKFLASPPRRDRLSLSNHMNAGPRLVAPLITLCRTDGFGVRILVPLSPVCCNCRLRIYEFCWNNNHTLHHMVAWRDRRTRRVLLQAIECVPEKRPRSLWVLIIFTSSKKGPFYWTAMLLVVHHRILKPIWKIH